MYQIYKLPEDYDFSYWSSPLEDLQRIQRISERRVHEWSITVPKEERAELSTVSSFVPTHYVATLSVAISESLNSLIYDHGVSYGDLSGIFIQRVPELEAGSDMLFILGMRFGSEKYAVTPMDMSERLKIENAVLLRTYEDQPEEPVVH
jgi:hypothetical protein